MAKGSVRSHAKGPHHHGGHPCREVLLYFWIEDGECLILPQIPFPLVRTSEKNVWCSPPAPRRHPKHSGWEEQFAKVRTQEDYFTKYLPWLRDHERTTLLAYRGSTAQYLRCLLHISRTGDWFSILSHWSLSTCAWKNGSTLWRDDGHPRYCYRRSPPLALIASKHSCSSTCSPPCSWCSTHCADCLPSSYAASCSFAWPSTSVFALSKTFLPSL